ncbi:MAG TPA: MarR family transcriptional regulator [Luteibaculaceae bacterium]|nr:MarR family transcriptional regulator [Luteibaculaceae bacterium]
MRPSETIEYPIRLVWNKIARYYNMEAAKYDTTMATGFILLNIDRNEGTPSTKLGPLLGLEPRSLVRILSTMEEKGLIERRKDAGDKRLVRIHLTPFGLEKREVSKKIVLDLNHYLQSSIPASQLEVFFEVLDTLHRKIDQYQEVLETTNAKA